MPDIDDWPTISAFTVAPSIGSIALSVEYSDPHQPNGLPYLKTAAFEYWASATDDVDTASKVAEGLAATSWNDAALVGGVTRYLWVRPRRESILASGQTLLTYGPFSAESGEEALIYSDNDEWVAYSPTVTAHTGSFGSPVVGATGRYKKRGRSVVVQASGFISDNGTGSNSVLFSVPIPVNLDAANIGMGFSTLGMCLVNAPVDSESKIGAVLYDGSYPIGSSGTVYVQIEYEAED